MADNKKKEKQGFFEKVAEKGLKVLKKDVKKPVTPAKTKKIKASPEDNSKYESQFMQSKEIAEKPAPVKIKKKSSKASVQQEPEVPELPDSQVMAERAESLEDIDLSDIPEPPNPFKEDIEELAKERVFERRAAYEISREEETLERIKDEWREKKKLIDRKEVELLKHEKNLLKKEEKIEKEKIQLQRYDGKIRKKLLAVDEDKKLLSEKENEILEITKRMERDKLDLEKEEQSILRRVKILEKDGKNLSEIEVEFLETIKELENDKQLLEAKENSVTEKINKLEAREKKLTDKDTELKKREQELLDKRESLKLLEDKIRNQIPEYHQKKKEFGEKIAMLEYSAEKIDEAVSEKKEKFKQTESVDEQRLKSLNLEETHLKRLEDEIVQHVSGLEKNQKLLEKKEEELVEGANLKTVERTITKSIVSLRDTKEALEQKEKEIVKLVNSLDKQKQGLATYLTRKDLYEKMMNNIELREKLLNKKELELSAKEKELSAREQHDLRKFKQYSFNFLRSDDTKDEKQKVFVELSDKHLANLSDHENVKYMMDKLKDRLTVLAIDDARGILVQARAVVNKGNIEQGIKKVLEYELMELETDIKLVEMGDEAKFKDKAAYLRDQISKMEMHMDEKRAEVDKLSKHAGLMKQEVFENGQLLSHYHGEVLDHVKSLDEREKKLEEQHKNMLKEQEALLYKKKMLAHADKELRDKEAKLKEKEGIIHQSIGKAQQEHIIETAKLEQLRVDVKTAEDELDMFKQKTIETEAELEQKKREIDESRKLLSEKETEVVEKVEELEHKQKDIEHAKLKFAAEKNQKSETMQNIAEEQRIVREQMHSIREEESKLKQSEHDLANLSDHEKVKHMMDKLKDRLTILAINDARDILVQTRDVIKKGKIKAGIRKVLEYELMELETDIKLVEMGGDAKFKDKAAYLRDQISKMEQHAGEKRAEIDKLSKHAELMKQEVFENEKLLSHYHGEVLDHVKSLDEREKKLEEQHKNMLKEQDGLLYKKKMLAHADEELRDKEDKLNEKEGIIHQSISKVQQEYLVETAKLEQLRVDVKTAEDELDMFKQKAIETEAELEQKKREIDESRKLLSEKETEVVEKVEELEHKQKDIEHAKLKLAAEKNQESETIRNIAEEHRIVREQMHSIREAETKLKQREHDLNLEYEAFQEKQLHLDKKIASLEKSKAAFRRIAELMKNDTEHGVAWTPEKLETEFSITNIQKDVVKMPQQEESEKYGADYETIHVLIAKANNLLKEGDAQRAEMVVANIQKIYNTLGKNKKAELKYDILALKTDVDIAKLSAMPKQA